MLRASTSLQMMRNAMPETAAASAKPRKILAARRLVLLASVAAIGGSLLCAGTQLPTNLHIPSIAAAKAQTAAAAQAQTVMRPASFADIVDQVKPAVFAVRVKTERGPEAMAFGDDNSPFPPGSPMERFFKRFGFGDAPNSMQQRRVPRQFAMSQGS